MRNRFFVVSIAVWMAIKSEKYIPWIMNNAK